MQARESLNFCKKNPINNSCGSTDDHPADRHAGSTDCIHEVSDGNKDYWELD